MKTKDHVLEARALHHSALKSMLPASDIRTGLQVWRQLRRIEAKAQALALQLCNAPEISEAEAAEADKIMRQIVSAVNDCFGYEVPGFFINLDPRGWALKLEPKSVPYPLHQDWGGYQILAPTIE